MVSECDLFGVLPGVPQNIMTKQDTHVDQCIVDGTLLEDAIPSARDKDAIPSARDKVLEAFLKLSEIDAVGFLRAARQSRPLPFQQVLGGTPNNIIVPADTSELREEAALEDFAKAMREPPLVQFSTFMYFVKESELEMTVDVLRIGDLSQCTEVHFTTVDGTAKAGKDFIQTSGVVSFEPGEDNKQISVPVIQSSTWNTTTEFALQLLHEPSATNAILGRYLWQARVKILDIDTFPSNRFAKEIQDGELEEVPKWSLFFEYLKLNWANPEVKRGTIKMFIRDQMCNVYEFLKLCAQVYLIDEVLVARKPDSPQTMLIIVAAMEFVPYVLLHFMELRSDVGGKSRAVLQNALIRKFLNYSEDARKELEKHDLVMNITRDCAEVVQSGYIGALDVLQNVGQLVAVLLFQVLAPVIFPQKGFNPYGFIVLAVLPTLLTVFLLLRRDVTMKWTKRKNDAQDELVGQTQRIIKNYRLIADYNRRPFFVNRFEDKVDTFNDVDTHHAKVIFNNSSASTWLTMLFIFGYTIIGGMTILSEEMGTPPEEQKLSLGMFLTNLGVIFTIGGSAGSIYKVVLQIQFCLPGLETVVMLMNLPIDLHQRLELNRHRRASARERRAEVRASGLAKGFPIDELPIVMDSFEHAYVGGVAERGALNIAGHISITQGNLAAMVGPRGEGKSTLLKILGGVILPKYGGFFLPAHLRVLHVSSEPFFFYGTLYENLVFGVAPGDSDGNMERVLAILESLSLPPKLLRYVRQGDDGDKCMWADVLSMSQKCLLCLARALIGNAEVLCLHRPTMPYDEATSDLVLELLSSFCRNKGIEQDPKTSHLRRPRTCIFTSTKILGIHKADEIFLVSKAGMRRIPKGEVTLDLLG